MKRLKALIKKQTGLTLIELLIALTITGIVTATSTLIIFQVFDGEARSNNHLDAISRVQNAGRQISLDAGMAQTSEWTDGDFPLKLTWIDWEDNETHEVYYIMTEELRRDLYIDGNLESSYTFEYITCEPDPDSPGLSFIVTATVGYGSQQISESRVYSITPRPTI